MALFTDPLDPRVNSYVSLAEANTILASRPYTETWEGTSEDPNAYDYVADGVTSAGASAITVKDGTGNFADGDTLTIAGDPQVYTVTADVAAPATSIPITPALGVDTTDLAQVDRLSFNAKEQALHWATSLLDDYFIWFGNPRYTCQQQALDWPRSGITDRDGCNIPNTVIPDQIKCATAEFANELLKRDLTTPPGVLGQGFKRAEIPGPMKIEVDPSQILPVFNNYFVIKLQEYGRLNPNAGQSGLRQLRLVRA
jgi:hypothetical protein